MSEIINIDDTAHKHAAANVDFGADPRRHGAEITTDQELAGVYLTNWLKFFRLYRTTFPDTFPSGQALARFNAQRNEGDDHTIRQVSDAEVAEHKTLMNDAHIEENLFEYRLVSEEIAMTVAGDMPFELLGDLEGLLCGKYAIADRTQTLLWSLRYDIRLPAVDNPFTVDQR